MKIIACRLCKNRDKCDKGRDEKSVKKQLKWWYAIGICALFACTLILRAHLACMTWDEVATYEYVCSIDLHNLVPSIIEIIRNSVANNHILNTTLIYLTQLITGVQYDELIIRMPSVCFGIVYAVVCLVSYKKSRMSLLEISLLLLNWHVSEFLSIARGYGMASCCVLIALIYIRQYADSDWESFRQLNFALLFLTLAASANTVSLLLTGSLFFYIAYQMLRNNKMIEYLKRAWYCYVPIGICNIGLVLFHFHISADGKPLYIGYGNVPETVLRRFIAVYTDGHFIRGALWGVVLFWIISFVFMKKEHRSSLFCEILVCFFVIVLVLQILLKKGIPTERTVIPFYPLFVLCIGECVSFWNEKISILMEKHGLLFWRTARNIITALMCGFLTVMFLKNTDLYSVRDWYEGKEIKHSAYEAIGRPIANRDTLYDALYEYPIWFYRDKILSEYGYDIFEGKYYGLKVYLDKFESINHNYIIEFDRKEVVNNPDVLEFLNSLGVDIRRVNENIDFCIIEKNRNIEYLYNCNYSESRQKTEVGTLSVFYDEEGNYGVYLDAEECYIVNVDDSDKIDIRILCWDDDISDGADLACFYYDEKFDCIVQRMDE